MSTISIRMPEDVVEDLKRVAPVLGFMGYQPLIRAYIGQGLRQTSSGWTGIPGWNGWSRACAAKGSTRRSSARRWRR